MKKFLLCILLVIFSITFAFSEDDGITKAIQSLSGGAVESYLGELPSAFLTNLNSGWFHKNPRAEIWGINFEIGVVAMGVPMGEMSENFSLTTKYTLTEAQAEKFLDASNLNAIEKAAAIKALTGAEINVEISGPTVFGSKNETVAIKVKDSEVIISDKEYTLNTGETYTIDEATGYGDDISGIDYIPTAAPQLTIGTIFGTNFSFRYVPKITLSKELGDFSYFGAGVQHNPKLWIPYINNLPFDYSFAFYYQKMEIGDIMKATAWSSGINISKEFGWRFLNITPYTSFLFEGSELNISYDYKVDSSTDPITFDFDIEGENKFRWVLGAGLRFGLVNLSADYTFAKTNSISASVNVAF